MLTQHMIGAFQYMLVISQDCCLAKNGTLSPSVVKEKLPDDACIWTCTVCCTVLRGDAKRKQ